MRMCLLFLLGFVVSLDAVISDHPLYQSIQNNDLELVQNILTDPVKWPHFDSVYSEKGYIGRFLDHVFHGIMLDNTFFEMFVYLYENLDEFRAYEALNGDLLLHRLVRYKHDCSALIVYLYKKNPLMLEITNDEDVIPLDIAVGLDRVGHLTHPNNILVLLQHGSALTRRHVAGMNKSDDFDLDQWQALADFIYKKYQVRILQ